jgi:hypothetical protein
MDLLDFDILPSGTSPPLGFQQVLLQMDLSRDCVDAWVLGCLVTSIFTAVNQSELQERHRKI